MGQPPTGRDNSDIDISLDIVNNAKALAPALGQGNDFMQGVIAANIIEAGAVGVAVAGPTVASLAAQRLLLGPALNRVFWSGVGYFAANSLCGDERRDNP